jgi:hypothetical protein
VEQIPILLLTLVMLACLTARRPRLKLGYLAGLYSQPFWVYTTFTHNQGLLLVVSFIFALYWIYGLYNLTRHPARPQVDEEILDESVDYLINQLYDLAGGGCPVLTADAEWDCGRCNEDLRACWKRYFRGKVEERRRN